MTIVPVAWLRQQQRPQSALARRCFERFSGRANDGKTTIPAVAPKLVAALCKHVSAGVVVEGVIIAAAG